MNEDLSTRRRRQTTANGAARSLAGSRYNSPAAFSDR
jgi:hypothetical protein